MLTEPIDLAHALSPTNDSERLLFRQLLPSLIRIDCSGMVRPDLARSWSTDSEGRVLTFTLREGARMPGGTPADAFHVVSLLASSVGKSAGVDSATELGDGRLRVHVHEESGPALRLLANPALALLDRLDSPDGGGPLNRFEIAAQDGRPLIDFQIAPNGDPRDAIDRGVDLAVTRDPAVVEYVARRGEFATYALPWSRTYLLVQPVGARSVDGVGSVDSLRRSLARDAVQADARPAEYPFWSDSLMECTPVSPARSQAASSLSPRIVYSRGDDVARGLAERIVALAGDAGLRSASIDPDTFAAALRQGAERGYVIAASYRPLNPCHEAAGWPAGASIQPLIDTRATAIVRRGSAPLTVDWDGTVRVVGNQESPGGQR
ncbi:MAG: hypothetical protein ACJ8BF_03515 [Gemmatimonadales bacterium]